jgi:formate dehydrogenase maturation protein FdhE
MREKPVPHRNVPLEKIVKADAMKQRKLQREPRQLATKVAQDNPAMDRSLQALLDRVYAKMTPDQIEEFDLRVREEAARLDAWIATPNRTKPKAAKKR